MSTPGGRVGGQAGWGLRSLLNGHQRWAPGARVWAGGHPRWPCWGPGAVVGDTEWGEDAVRGSQDCRRSVRTGADETGWKAVTQGTWEERQRDAQTDREEIHGVAPEDSFWTHPDTWHHRTVTGTELEPAGHRRMERMEHLGWGRGGDRPITSITGCTGPLSALKSSLIRKVPSHTFTGRSSQSHLPSTESWLFIKSATVCKALSLFQRHAGFPLGSFGDDDET